MPARKRLPYLAGLKVRLRAELETEAGTKFPKDTICRIIGADTAKLHLSMRNPDPLNIFGPRHLSIHGVRRYWVEWLTPDGKEPLDPKARPKNPRKAPEVA